MNESDLQVSPMSSPVLAANPDDSAAMPEASDPVWRILATVVRYWKWVLPLTLVLAIVGAVAGYRLTPVKYRSSGYIRLRPILPRVLYQTEQTGVMPMFDSFVESQVTLMTSQRLVSMAMQNPQWKAFGRGTTPDQIEQFEASLEVIHPRGAEMILVAYTDRDAEVAVGGVRAIIEAYEKIYTEADGAQNAQTIQRLEDRRAALTAEVKALNDRIVSIANEFGSTDLNRIYDFKLTDLSKLESELQQVQVAIALTGGKASSASSATRPVSASAEAIARVDPEMREYMRQRQVLTRKLELLKLRLLPNHRDVVEAEAEINALSREIAQYAEQYRQRSSMGLSVGDGSAEQSGLLIQGLQQLVEREQNLTVLVERGRRTTLDLGRKQLQIAGLQSEVAATQKRLAETEARLEQLTVESGVGGRLSILSYGETPNSPYNDKRKQAAAGGGMAGVALGLGAALATGLANRRCRSIADARQTIRRAEKLLGILPALPEDLSNPEQAATAAHYVHHIRVLLQLGGERTGPAAIAITSSASRSGKTSLCQALSLSFAGSGARTLLVDCDIIGGGLTRRMGVTAHRKLGEILLREGLVVRREVEAAVRTAQAMHRRIGDVLVENGCVSAADIAHALSLQKESNVGLLDMLAGESLMDCIAGTGIENLSILPLGAATAQDIGRLSPAGIRRILVEAKASFDAVVIDTGPVPGSVEASMVTAVADQVIMVVSRGEHRHIVEHALDYLLSLGVKVAGVVFNRAKSADIASSGYSSRMSTATDTDTGRSVEARAARLGPVARAVASTVEAPELDARGEA